jgi:RluA family pseudouridine synthase
MALFFVESLEWQDFSMKPHQKKRISEKPTGRSLGKLSKKYQPKGFEILHEDPDLIVGCKAPGYLTVAALWERENTIHNILNMYVRKGSAHSKKCVFVVHRIDQATSGILIFAKTQEAQIFLKENWKSTEKIYYAIVQGKMEKKKGLISSYLSEDEDYVVHSSKEAHGGKLAQTEYEVVKETSAYSVVKVHLITGKKNQIRVHMAGQGHPIVGDQKYGFGSGRQLMLHAFSVVFTHPFSKKRIRIQADVPTYFRQLVDYSYT